MSKAACFTSLTDKWNTPKSIYEKLDAEFHFDFDPCPENPSFDGLERFFEWGDRNFINPPFSNWQKWVKKGYEQWVQGSLCVFLLAARTDTKAFHEYILPYATEIRFIKGRLKFGGSKHCAPFPSMVVVFDKEVS